jgi:uncharacterized RDD family membrane protein YckC
MTRLLIETSEGVRLRVEIAGAGSRFAAGLLDGIVLVLGLLVTLLVLSAAHALDQGATTEFLIGLLTGGTVLIAIAYHVIFHVLAGGRTPGKMALGIRVVSADGRPASTLAIVLRGLIQPIDVMLTMPVSVGLILIGATPRHQRLGDLAAGTMVVHDKRREWLRDPYPGETWRSLPVRTLPLTPGLEARLTPDDRALLRTLVSREGLEEEARRRLFIDAARMFAEKLELGAFEDARVVLKELYLFVREMAAERPA